MLAPLLAASPTQFDLAFNRLYNFDFPSAHRIVDRYIAEHSAEPLPYAIRASAYLFAELDRLGILEGEFFVDDKRIIEKKKLKPDQNARTQFLKAIEEAQARANRVLASSPLDRDALFTMSMTQGLATDYMALVEKRQIASLTPAKQSNAWAQKLLRIDPHYYDAYLTTGLTEYLVGSIPFFIRWFIRFENISGSKEKGVETLRLVSQKGRFLKPFSKILLAIAYVRDKKPKPARDLLAELTQDYPGNPLLRKELAKVEATLGASGN
jgi:predicted Zn-dependent protease